jgi:hypothetical protein
MLRPRRRPGELILNGSISSSVSAAHRLFVFLTPGDPSSLVRRHWYNGNKLLRCNRRSFVFHASNEIKKPHFRTGATELCYPERVDDGAGAQSVRCIHVLADPPVADRATWMIVGETRCGERSIATDGSPRSTVLECTGKPFKPL